MIATPLSVSASSALVKTFMDRRFTHYTMIGSEELWFIAAGAGRWSVMFGRSAFVCERSLRFRICHSSGSFRGYDAHRRTVDRIHAFSTENR
ncbi:MAG: hypothetical protein HGB20_03600 [Chlorobiaceae bacterium]|nr:hypothetical protein [Chlorobiaceae bacterium]